MANTVIKKILIERAEVKHADLLIPLAGIRYVQGRIKEI